MTGREKLFLAMIVVAVALFFAILHLGVLVVGTGGINAVTGIYLAGLGLALLALILG